MIAYDNPQAVIGSNVAVTLSDASQWWRAERTIKDLRNAARWQGDICFIAVEFVPPHDFVDQYDVIVHETIRVDTRNLEEKLDAHPFLQSIDGRERTKTIQWTKLRVFEPWVRAWKRALFVDAGFRIFHSIEPLFDIPEGKILALDDTRPEGEPERRLGCQIEKLGNLEVLQRFLARYPDALDAPFFLNCAFAFDTALVEPSTFSALASIMNEYPIFLTNEMAAMNVYFHLQRKAWQPLPLPPVLDWTERGERTWRDYIGLKYPHTIGWDND